MDILEDENGNISYENFTEEEEELLKLDKEVLVLKLSAYMKIHKEIHYKFWQ